MYLWDSKAGSFVGCSAITVSRAGLDMVLREEIPPLPGIIQLMASNFTDPLLPAVGLCS